MYTYTCLFQKLTNLGLFSPALGNAAGSKLVDVATLEEADEENLKLSKIVHSNFFGRGENLGCMSSMTATRQN